MQSSIALPIPLLLAACAPFASFPTPVTVTAQDVAPAANAIASIIRLRLPPGQDILRVESPSDETGQAIGKELVRVLQTQGYRIEDNPRAAHRIGFAVMPLKAGALLTVTIDGGTRGHAPCPRCRRRHGPGLRPLLPGGIAMSQAPEDSPNELTPAPHVRRLNRVPLLIAGVLLSVLLAAVAYSYYARLAKTTGKPEEAQKPEAAPVFLKDAPDAGFIPREKETPRPNRGSASQGAACAPPEPQDEARKLAWESYRQKLERRRALREEATLQAVLANTKHGVCRS